nr:ATP synthase F0 subunit 6 [Moina macrocopa]BDH80287.1 ATP synthase F0 subunit 6 [Moina macrocopa]
MMANLFSIFDPVASFNLPLNWLAVFLGIFMLPWSFWVQPNRHFILIKTLSVQLHKEFKTLVGPTASSGHTLIFISLFLFIMYNNLLGLLPYVFTATSHLAMTLSLAFPLWISFMIYGWFNHTKHMLAHLVPLGTPPVLMPFMVLIETISNMIRPGTLAVRLAANMIAGHLLLVLLGNQGPHLSSPVLTLLLVTQILLLTLETAVAVIQSYVFAVLATLYSSEVA